MSVIIEMTVVIFNKNLKYNYFIFTANKIVPKSLLHFEELF
jgi:hypothetical protein